MIFIYPQTRFKKVLISSILSLSRYKKKILYFYEILLIKNIMKCSSCNFIADFNGDSLQLHVVKSLLFYKWFYFLSFRQSKYKFFKV